MHSLQVIAHTFHMAILITNQVQNDYSYIAESKPIGGNVLAHTSTYIVQLRPSRDNRTAKMIASPYHPVRDAKFTICERGIDDPEETLYRYKNPHTTMSHFNRSFETNKKNRLVTTKKRLVSQPLSEITDIELRT
jgi:hypothetical protein